ncbi:MAG TPA: hypothetical protein VF629_00735 [Hymenobacter sp.]|jgi:hypothetical protein|uniref:hypothetical protein n=1 Tax=Hymenobacter sp. TaxID=1898978 RepID=UPI002EDABCA8
MSFLHPATWALLGALLLLALRGQGQSAPDSLAQLLRAEPPDTAAGPNWRRVALGPRHAVRLPPGGTNTRTGTIDSDMGELRTPNLVVRYDAGGMAGTRLLSRTRLRAQNQALLDAHVVDYWATVPAYGYLMSAASMWDYLGHKRPPPLQDPQVSEPYRSNLASFMAYRECARTDGLVTLGLRQGADGPEAVATVYVEGGRGPFPETANFSAAVKTRAHLREFLQVVCSYTRARTP